MMKKTFFKMLIPGCLFFLFFLSACNQESGTSVITPPGTKQTSIVQLQATATPRATATASQPIPTATPIVIPTVSQPVPTATPAATPTAQQIDYAAVIGSYKLPNQHSVQAENIAFIDSAGDRPVALIGPKILNVPARAKGIVYIQNNSDLNQMLVSDTPNGFATFLIAHGTTTSLIFYRAGTFKAHLRDYPVNTYTSITIVITTPFIK